MSDALEKDFPVFGFDRPAPGVLRLTLDTGRENNVIDGDQHEQMANVWPASTLSSPSFTSKPMLSEVVLLPSCTYTNSPLSMSAWLNSPIAKLFILAKDVANQDTMTEEDADDAAQARRERLAALRELIGADGMTITSLRPVGTVKIGDHRIDALAETGVIEANTPVIVTDVYDNQIKVRPS